MTDNFAERFVAQEGIYLLNHSVGRPPVSSRKQLEKDFFELWEHGDAEVWPQWLAQIDGFRGALARLLNARMQDFCPQTNLSSGLTKLIHSLPVTGGKSTILFHEQDFPSIGFVLQRAQRSGWNYRVIPAGADPQDLGTWQSQITDDIGVVLITHVHSNTSAALPVPEIVELVRRSGAVSIVDIAQSVGVVPIDLGDWQPDFVLGSCVKWLCGGPGAGFIWAQPAQVERCKPIDVGWFSHENPFEFDINDFRYAHCILRFWGGTPSVLPYVVAANSIDVLLDIGIETISAHNLRLNQRLIDQLDVGRIVTPTGSNQRGGTLVLNFGERQSRVEQKLREATVHFDVRSTGIRLSPHIYNNDDDINVVLDCLTL